ncbi:Uncharacterised protein [Vibrio cholerae]|nr:Uncharacterised protein [Vibrio cholerae]
MRDTQFFMDYFHHWSNTVSGTRSGSDNTMLFRVEDVIVHPDHDIGDPLFFDRC